MSDSDVPKWFLDLAGRNTGMRSFTESGLRDRFGEPSEINLERGQLWRAGWADVAVLLVLLELGDGEVRASPVTIDPPAEDENGFVLAPTCTGLPTSATVWTGFTRFFPQRVLDTLVAAWSADLTTCLANPASLDPGSRLPVGMRRGRPIDSEFDHRSMIRAGLEDDVDQLGQMPGLPVESPGSSSTTLAAVLGDVDLAALCAALKLPQPAVMKLLRGTAPLTPAQAAVIAQTTGISQERVLGAVRSMPRGLVQAADHPRWRQVWITRARRLGTDETQARLDGCQQAFALAARQTGGSEPDWDARLQRALFGEGGELR
ncbi:hypothetical protein [Labedaea rhizosphaerae]|uniref:Uncharacterized protein n=1 Tax=Labedaea rhizosphaerae TaxID=598644 RepID=A0A4R6SEQ1_LABRH|nr:hypothetical protein [Labedaea rhizosphaerae]TDP98153.1 hypothetical protein EV186_1031133 [Labedaea rhizosphaerae]